ncbi:MAG: helix-turn-helix transcriptional regulator [Tabrizicola sp.]|jgi:transcriptional regulator with XRE-family HTH domain|nr:helix-turn-helix transcriptional regulator [Tabrizicola sp.]
MPEFSQALKGWRQVRRLSQLDLATEAAVSPRHLAFLETGRARPSRGMVLRLAQVLDLPRSEQNTLLTTAGFSPQFPAFDLGSVEMSVVRQAMEWMISRHAPYPALILDRTWRIIALNRPAETIFGAVGFAVGTSLLDALNDLSRFEAMIENWAEVGHSSLLRLRSESARAGGIAALDRAAAILASDPRISGYQPTGGLRAIVPTIYRLHGQRLAMVSTYAQFGSAEEVSLADMKIELMFPADPAAEAMLQGLGSPP